MGLLFLGDERQNFVAMIGKKTQRVKDLGFGNSQVLRDFGNWFTNLVQHGHVADGYSKAINHRLTTAKTFTADNVRVVSFYSFTHFHSSERKGLYSSLLERVVEW
jgi:hypothetical protein